MAFESAEFTPYLDLFPTWLETLGADVRELTSLLSSRDEDDASRRLSVGLDYVVRSMSLLADGTEELSYFDDAFVLRVAALRACEADESARDGLVARLAQEAEVVAAFLGEGEYEKLLARVDSLLLADGRAVKLDDAMAWAHDYAVPEFKADARSLIRLRAFVTARLAS
jgi:hypothetical protein